MNIQYLYMCTIVTCLIISLTIGVLGVKVTKPTYNERSLS